MRIHQSTWGVTLVAIAVMVASAVVLVGDFQSEAASHRRVMLARGQTALDALTAGIRAQGRMGRYRHDRLSYIFEELAATPDIVGVVLCSEDGTLISSGGDTTMIADRGERTEVWTSGNLALWRGVSLDTGGHGFGRGRGGAGNPNQGADAVWEPIPGGPHFLAVVLNTSAMEGEIRGDQIRLFVSLAATVLLVMLGAAAVLGSLRRRRLQTALLVAREQAMHQSHLALLGAGLAHETRNPLGIVRGQAQLIADSPGDAAGNRVRAEGIVDEIDRATGHINAFLALARPLEITPTPLELGPFLKKFASLIEDEVREKKAILTVAAPELTIRADEPQLRRALLNLLLNALCASSPGDRIDLETTEHGGAVTLRVRDTGCGIHPEDLSRVAEPYFSRFEGGYGLGLTLVRQVAEAHGWVLDIASVPDEGTVVSLNGIERITPVHG